MALPTNTLTLETKLTDGVTPLEGEWTIRIVSANGVAVDLSTGEAISTPPPTDTVGGVVTFELADNTHADFEPSTAKYQGRFRSHNRRNPVDFRTDLFDMDTDKNTDDVYTGVAGPVDSSVLASALAAQNAAQTSATAAAASAAAAQAVGTTSDGIMATIAADAGSDFRGVLDDIFAVTDSLYGAVGDGVADDTAAIQAAIDAAEAAGGGTVRFARGTYKTTATLTIESSRVSLAGEGSGSTISYTGSGTAVRFGTKTSTVNDVDNNGIRNLRILGTSSGAMGLHLIGVRNAQFSDVTVDSFTGTGAIGVCYDTRSASPYLATINCVWVGGWIQNCTNGIKLTKDAGDPGTDGCNHNSFFGLRVSGFTGIGFDIDWGENNACYGVDSSASVNGTTGFRINDDVNGFYQCRADNSSSGVGAADAYGFYITASGRDHTIINPTGNGPLSAQRVYYVDKANTLGLVVRNSFNRWAGAVDFDRLPTINGVAMTTGGSGVSDHGALTGLSDDDHTQYHNNTRGDARYYTKAQVDTSLSTHTHTAGQVSGLADVATSGAFADLSGTQPTGAATWDGSAWSSPRQDVLIMFWVGGEYPTDEPTDAQVNDIWYPETVAP